MCCILKDNCAIFRRVASTVDLQRRWRDFCRLLEELRIGAIVEAIVRVVQHRGDGIVVADIIRLAGLARRFVVDVRRRRGRIGDFAITIDAIDDNIELLILIAIDRLERRITIDDIVARDRIRRDCHRVRLRVVQRVVAQDVAGTRERFFERIRRVARIVRAGIVVEVCSTVVFIVDLDVVYVAIDQRPPRRERMRSILQEDRAILRRVAFAVDLQRSFLDACTVVNRHTSILVDSLAIQGVVLQVKAICTVNSVERNYRIVDILASILRNTPAGLRSQSAGANNHKIELSVTIDVLELRRTEFFEAVGRTIFCRIACTDICVRKRIRINLNPVFLSIVHLVIPKDIRSTLQALIEIICSCIIGARIIILIRTTIVTIVDIDIIYITIDKTAPGREAMCDIVCDDCAISRFIACAIDGKRCFLNIDFANGMTSCIFSQYYFIILCCIREVSTCRDGVRTSITGVMLSSNGICHDRTVWLLFECRLIILNGNMCAQFSKNLAWIFFVTIRQAFEMEKVIIELCQDLIAITIGGSDIIRNKLNLFSRDACRLFEVFGCLAVIELVILGQSIAERYRRIVVTSEIIGDSPSIIASQSVGAGDVELIAAVAVDGIERCRTKIIRLRAVDRLEERAAFEAEFITRNRVLVDGDVTITSDGVVRIGFIGEVNIAEQELIVVGTGISGNTIRMSILAGSICTTVADGILDTRRIKLITVGKALTFCTRLSIDVLILERSIAIGLRCTAVQDNGTTRDFQFAFIRKICNAVAF